MDRLRNSPLWRLTAIVALVLLGVSAILGVALVLRNPGLSIVFCLTCIAAAAVAWRWLLGTRPKPAWPYAVGETLLLVLLVAEVIVFARDQRNILLVLVLLVLSGLGLSLAALLRRRYLQEGSTFVVPTGERPFLIVNPKSGSGRAMKANIPALARAKGIKVLMLEPGGSLTKLVSDAVSGGATMLGMSGGDGSLGVAAAAAISHNLPLVVLPGGTRCHFARDIGLDPDQIADSLRSFGGRVVRVDAAEINGRTFLNNASFGLYADIVQRPGYREHKIGSSFEVLESAATERGYPLEFDDAKGNRRDHALVVLVGVNEYETLNVLELGSRTSMDQGVLQINVIYRLEQSLLKQVTGAMNLTGFKSKFPQDLDQWTTHEFSIAGPTAQTAAGVDGELVEFDSPLILKILPRALRLMVPPEGPHHRRTSRTAATRIKDFAVSGKLPDD